MFNVVGLNKVNRAYIFSGMLQYLPRIGEQMEFDGMVYDVNNIIYTPTNGNSLNVNVRIYLTFARQ